MKRLLAAAAAACIAPTYAADFTSLNSLTQGEFHRLAEDLGSALSYKGVTPATPLGPIGFDLGVEVTATRMENSSLFARAGAGSHSQLVVPKLHVNKGLFAGFDVGAFVGGSSDLSAALFGLDLRYAIVNDTLTTPAVAVRLSGTRATGLGDLKIATAAADLMVSKSFVMITPYVGAGLVRVQATVENQPIGDEKFNRSRVFGGLNVNLVGANFAVEAEKMGGNTSLSAKVGVRF